MPLPPTTPIDRRSFGTPCARFAAMTLASLATASALAGPINVTESPDFGATAPYVNVGPLGLGTNVITGGTQSGEGRVNSAAILALDTTDGFEVTLDAGYRIHRLEVDFSGLNAGWQAIGPDDVLFANNFVSAALDLNLTSPGSYRFIIRDEAEFDERCRFVEGTQLCETTARYYGSSYTVRLLVDAPTAQVPTPGSGPLTALALLALAWQTRRRLAKA